MSSPYQPPNTIVQPSVTAVTVVNPAARTTVIQDGRGLGPAGPAGTPGTPGATGQPGAAGSAPQAYTHIQNAVSDVWSITHNLGFQPNVGALDSGGSEVEGDIERLDFNNLRIHFTSAFAGTAYLS